MSATQIRGQLARKRDQQTQAEKKAGEFRAKESKKRTEAVNSHAAATRTKSASTARSKTAEARRKEKEAELAGKEAARWQTRATTYAKEVASLQARLDKAVIAEQKAAELKRQREQRQTERRQATAHEELRTRLAATERTVASVLREIPEPRQEKLRVLVLTSSGEGDLRVGRETRQIRSAVQAAVLRDYIEFDLRPAATPQDLLSGIAEFRPHVVHFSGHSAETFVVFEADVDEPNSGVAIPADVFARAIAAVDTPPSLVVFNSCSSASQADALVEGVVPFAIGMSDSVEDGDAIRYSARFYGAVANGQSIAGAHELARTDLAMGGTAGADIPTLASADGYDPRDAVLVTRSD